MLTAIGDFLAILVTPLDGVGQLLGLNAAAATAVAGTTESTMATSIFAVTLGPFVEATGAILVGLGDIVTATSSFLTSLAGLM